MIRKFMIVLLVIMLAFSSSLLAIATDETEDYVNITSPKVGESGKTILNDSLFISIYVQSEETLFLSLKKKMPTFVFEADTTEVKELIPLVPAVPVEEAVEVKVLLSEVVEMEPLTKNEIASAYQIAEADLEIIKSDLIKAQSAVENIPSLSDETSTNFNSTYQLTDEEIDALKYLEDVKVFYNSTLIDYEKWQKQYNELFEKDVFEQQEMVVDPSFPYFEHIVSDIEQGQYKLVITNLEGKVIKMLEFEVMTEEVITKEIIENKDIFDKFNKTDEVFE